MPRSFSNSRTGSGAWTTSARSLPGFELGGDELRARDPRVLGFDSRVGRENFHDRLDGRDIGVEGRPPFDTRLVEQAFLGGVRVCGEQNDAGSEQLFHDTSPRGREAVYDGVNGRC